MDRPRSEPFFRTPKEVEKQKVVQEIALENDQVVLDVSYAKALRTEVDQIQMGPFTSVYGKADVARDLRDVEDRKRKFTFKKDPVSEAGQRRGNVLEAILTEQIDLNQWFGEGVVTQHTSDFDDVFQGVDMIIKFPEGEGTQPPPLLVDFTTTSSKDILLDKLSYIARDVRSGNLGKIKYDQSPDGKPLGALHRVPKILLVLDPLRLTDLARTWVQGKQRTLEKHPVRALLLYEISTQLESQMKLAARFKQQSTLDILAKSYEWVSQYIRDEKIVLPEEKTIERKQNNPYHLLRETFNDQYELWREPFPIKKPPVISKEVVRENPAV
ncbi:MAG: hypothetical protein NTX72_00180 [Candidatus Uhrbacteria bacterium]|nr:hypothetical protein [Candidatus Uhrbacteria bacterium]